MSTGVMQSDYRLPKTRCTALWDDFYRAGLLRSPGFALPDDGLLVGLRPVGHKTIGVSFCFAECKAEDDVRQIEFHWLAPADDEIVAKIADSVRKNGGIEVLHRNPRKK